MMIRKKLPFTIRPFTALSCAVLLIFSGCSAKKVVSVPDRTNSVTQFKVQTTRPSVPYQVWSTIQSDGGEYLQPHYLVNNHLFYSSYTSHGTPGGGTHTTTTVGVFDFDLTNQTVKQLDIVEPGAMLVDLMIRDDWLYYAQLKTDDLNPEFQGIEIVGAPLDDLSDKTVLNVGHVYGADELLNFMLINDDIYYVLRSVEYKNGVLSNQPADKILVSSLNRIEKSNQRVEIVRYTNQFQAENVIDNQAGVMSDWTFLANDHGLIYTLSGGSQSGVYWYDATTESRVPVRLAHPDDGLTLSARALTNHYAITQSSTSTSTFFIHSLADGSLIGSFTTKTGFSNVFPLNEQSIIYHDTETNLIKLWVFDSAQVSIAKLDLQYTQNCSFFKADDHEIWVAAVEMVDSGSIVRVGKITLP